MLGLRKYNGIAKRSRKYWIATISPVTTEIPCSTIHWLEYTLKMVAIAFRRTKTVTNASPAS